MPKAFCHLAAALACTSTGGCATLLRPWVPLPPEVAVQLEEDLGPGDRAELLIRMNTLSKAAKKNVGEMQSAGHPEAQPEKLRVGKLLAAMRDGKRPNFDWNSLPAWAIPEVAKVAIEERQISTPEQWDSVPDAARENSEVLKLAIQRHLLNLGLYVKSTDLFRERRRLSRAPGAVVGFERGPRRLSRAAGVLAHRDPEVAKLAIDERLISTPEEWDLLPATVRTEPEVVIVAMESGLLDRRWNSLPAAVREHPGVLQAYRQREAVHQLHSAMRAAMGSDEAIEADQDPPPVVDIDWDSLPPRAWPKVVRFAIGTHQIWTPEQWESLPAAVRGKPEVVAEAVLVANRVDNPAALLQTREQWDSFPAEVREHPLVVRAALTSCKSPTYEDNPAIPGPPPRSPGHSGLICTPEQYLEVPAEVRERGDVAKSALLHGLIPWDQVPAVLRNDVEWVADAIAHELITTNEQWNSLPPHVREDPQVVSAIIRTAWEKLPYNLDEHGNRMPMVLGPLLIRQSWDQVPAALHGDSEVVEQALHLGLITTPEQWISLPLRVRLNSFVQHACRRAVSAGVFHGRGLRNQGQFQ